MEKRVLAGLLGLFLVAYLAPLWARPLFEPDELRYAEIPREMLQTGDWVVPRLDGFRYFEKPPLGYWLTASAMGVFGENRFALRLPEALAAGLTALALFMLLGRFGGGTRAAAAAAGVLLSCGMFYAMGCFNVLDMPLTMFLTVAMVFLYLAWEAGGLGRKALFLALYGAAVGGAFLTKGFLAVAVPTAVIVPFMIWRRRTAKLLRLVWLPTTAAVAVSLPWSLAIAARAPDFWRYFFWEEHVRRFFSGHAQHEAPFWFFVPVILAGALPWTLFAPAAAAGLRREWNKTPLIRFLVCWLLFPFLFFSASRGKLGTYILPCFPPLAALYGIGLLSYFESGRRKAFAAAATALACAFGVCGAALVAGWAAGIRQFPYGRGEEWKWLILVAALGFGVAAMLRAARAARALSGGSRRAGLAWVCVAPCVIMAAAQFALPETAAELAAPEGLLASELGRVAPGAPLFARAAEIPATTWEFRRDDISLLDSTGEMSYGLTYPDAKGREYNIERFRAFVERCPRTGLVTAVMDREYYDREKAELPKAEYIVMDAAIVFAQYRGGGTGKTTGGGTQ